MKNRLIVSAVIKNGNKILLGRKPEGKGPYPDTWHIPGGGVNANESAEEAILREIKEETGLRVDNLVKVAWDTDTEPDKNGEEMYYFFLQFVCDFSSGTLRAGDDMHKFEWVDIKNLSKYNLNKPTKILFKKLGYLK